jgi:hypothetical protein
MPGRTGSVGIAVLAGALGLLWADRLAGQEPSPAEGLPAAGLPTATPPAASPRAEVTVTASQFSLGQAVAGVPRVLTREEIERLPNLGDDPIRLLSQLPGATASDFSAMFHVRGGEEREVQVKLDGQLLDQPFHLRGFLSTASILDPRAVAGIEVYSGGYPAPVGGALSSVIDMTTRSAALPLRFTLGASIVAFSGMGEGTFDAGEGRWLLSARRGFLDLALRMTDVTLDERFDPRFGDAYAKVEHALGSRQTLALSVLWAADDIGYHDSSQDAASNTGDVYGNLVLRSVVTDRLYVETGLEAGRVATRREGTSAGGGVDGVYRDDRTMQFLGARQGAELSFSSSLLKAGWELRTQDAAYSHASSRKLTDPVLLSLGFPAQQTILFAPSPSGTAWAAYASGRVPLGKEVTAEAGLRAEGATWSGSAEFLPRLGLAVGVGRGTTLRAAWGLFSQPQGIDELYPEERSDRFFPSSTAEHRVLSADTALGAGVGLRVEAWQKLTRRVVPRWENVFDPIESLPEIQGDRVRVAPESAEAKGVEVLLRRETTHLGLYLAWTLSKATERLAGVDVLRSWDQTHAVTASAVWRPGQRSSLAATFLYHTGWPYTDVLLAGSTPVMGPRNAVRHPDYHRLDLRASHRFSIGRTSLRAYVEVMNAYNRHNECCINSIRLRKPSGAPAYLDIRYEDWIGRIPSFGVELEF